MQEVKIYTVSPSDLSPPVQSESFCVDMVLASDYAALESRCAALSAKLSMINDLMEAAEQANKLARIALASLEAEPIGAFHIVDQQVGGTSDYIKDGEWPIDNGVIEVYAAPPASEREQIRRKTEPVAYLVCNGHLYQDRPFLDLSTARKSVKDRNDGAEIKALCVCEISAEK
ncbi:hypothetical protein NU118_000324 [Salmonella enterica]|nr:hypothetical protein [Salmonella enterica subsp. enterica serovar Tallahassee]EIG0993114.1 hypothetical protein [Salmonella enterica]EIW2673499.1 hypothetical protein [Salmonella enterica]EIW3005252.1 hypothetical protein [Salmonella enterica]EJP2996000.1 hypothetical protein [Salmonella enterica]